MEKKKVIYVDAEKNEQQHGSGVPCDDKTPEQLLQEQIEQAQTESKQTQNEAKEKAEKQKGKGKQKPKPEKEMDDEMDDKEDGEGEGEGKQEKEPDKEFVIELKDIDLLGAIKEQVSDHVESNAPIYCEEFLTERVRTAIANLAPVYVKVGEREEIKLEGRQHKAFKECLFLAQQERQLFISGPAGSGKTTLGEQLSKALGLSFSFISCSAGLSEAHLLGRMLFDGTYVESDFVKCYEEGGVFLFDEIDAADSNTLLIVNSALANGLLSIPNRKGKQHAKRHKDFICVCAGNTWGNGSFEYHGRNHLDAAFLDRFAVSKVHVDYDRELEAEICGDKHKALAIQLWKLRDNCIKNKIRKIVSTRAFISGTRQLMAGVTHEEIIERFFVGWSMEEKTKALQN